MNLSTISEQGEREITRRLSYIHALAKHLLRVGDDLAHQIFIGVQPNGEAWNVQVGYAGFLLEKSAAKLSDALEMVLTSLIESVSHQMEEAARLLDQK